MSQRTMMWTFSLLSFLVCTLGLATQKPTESYDAIIKNIKIIDGTGKSAFAADIAFKGDRIAAVGEVEGQAPLIIDGQGLFACPGFVDVHTHADYNIKDFPLAENFIMQGVTTVLAGNCGASAAPTSKMTFRQWLDDIEKGGLSINMASLVGIQTIRRLAMDQSLKRAANSGEIEKMKLLVEEAMESGSFGVSGWLDPGFSEYSSPEEIIELAKVAKRYGGIYSPHTRNHQNNWYSEDSGENGYGIVHTPEGYGLIPQYPKGEVSAGRYHGLVEAIEIARKADNIPLLIAHFTPAYNIPQPHPEWLQEAVARATLTEIIDPAWKRGQKVYFNAIACPYSIGNQQPIISIFLGQTERTSQLAVPAWFKNLSRNQLIEGLKSQEFRDKLKGIFFSGKFKVEMVHPLTDPYWMDCYKILTCKNDQYVGRTVGELARKRSPDSIIKAVYNDSVEVLFDILVEDPDATWALILDKREMPGALPVFFKHPAGVPCTDTGCLPVRFDENSKPGPTAYGIFPLYIDTYVKIRKSMSLEEAIKKAAYVPAQEILGLKDRGILIPGAFADVVIFDFDKISMAGDYLHPAVPPEGVEYVFVNGALTYNNKRHTGAKSGKVLRNAY